MRRSPGFARPWRSRTSRSRNAPTRWIISNASARTIWSSVSSSSGPVSSRPRGPSSSRLEPTSSVCCTSGRVTRFSGCTWSTASVYSPTWRIESGATAPALDLARRGMSEAEEILEAQPQVSSRIAGTRRTQLPRDAEISWDLGESDRALADLDRAEAILRQLVASHPEVAHGRLRPRGHDPPPRPDGFGARSRSRRRAPPARGDGAHRSGAPRRSGPRHECPRHGRWWMATWRPRWAVAVGPTRRVPSSLVPSIGSIGHAARSPRDVQIRRTLARTLAARADLLRRLGQLRGSLDDWDRAIALAADTDVPGVSPRSRGHPGPLERLPRRPGGSRRGRPVDRRPGRPADGLRPGPRGAGRCHPSRSIADAGRPREGVATQVAAALERIGQARRSPAYRDARRLYQRLGDHDFDPLREQPAFAMLMRDLAFPAQPFAHQD